MEKTYPCPHCSKNYTTALALSKHNSSCHLQTNESGITTTVDCFPCDQCKRIYVNKSSLRYHQYSHQDVPPKFTCNILNCKKSFTNPKRLSEHKLKHISTRLYLCEYCGYLSGVRCNLQVHLRIHTKVKPYLCELCAKCFPSRYQLTAHEQTHKKLRTHTCPECNLKFSDWRTLYHHKPLHCDQMKFSCLICGKKCAQSAGLSQHMRWHKKRYNTKLTNNVKVDI